MINVCDIQVMKPLLAEHGFHFSKAKGQNFLIASWVPASIAQESGVDEHTAEREACLLEHTLSDDSFAKLKRAAEGKKE